MKNINTYKQFVNEQIDNDDNTISDKYEKIKEALYNFFRINKYSLPDDLASMEFDELRGNPYIYVKYGVMNLNMVFPGRTGADHTRLDTYSGNPLEKSSKLMRNFKEYLKSKYGIHLYFQFPTIKNGGLQPTYDSYGGEPVWGDQKWFIFFDMSYDILSKHRNEYI